MHEARGAFSNRCDYCRAPRCPLRMPSREKCNLREPGPRLAQGRALLYIAACGRERDLSHSIESGSSFSTHTFNRISKITHSSHRRRIPFLPVGLGTAYIVRLTQRAYSNDSPLIQTTRNRPNRRRKDPLFMPKRRSFLSSRR